MLTFDIAFDRLIKNEGGFTAHPSDRGNWTSGKVGVGILKGTNWGISAMSYPKLNIRALTREQAKQIYLQDFWAVTNGFYPGLQFQMFDAAVNHGMHYAKQFAQRAVKVKDDGVIGPVTRAAVLSYDLSDILMLYVAQRLRFWAQIPGDEFDDGWMVRAAQNLEFAAADN